MPCMTIASRLGEKEEARSCRGRSVYNMTGSNSRGRKKSCKHDCGSRDTANAFSGNLEVIKIDVSVRLGLNLHDTRYL